MTFPKPNTQWNGTFGLITILGTVEMDNGQTWVEFGYTNGAISALPVHYFHNGLFTFDADLDED
ncbi:MAG: hypothetical protein LPK38_05880 [Actinomycetes bacterium]|nr:hypothetical protein [Actinomycetes bacterium]MDX5450564.1 hypothetical protein [Actinomycetes bacterium]